MQLKARPCVGTLTRYPPWLQLIRKFCVYIACCCYALVYTNRSLAALLLLLLCLPAAANFYIVVSQDVVIVAQLLYLKCMHVLALMLLATCIFPPRHQHLCAFILYCALWYCMLSRIVHVYRCTSTNELVRLCSFGSLVLGFRSDRHLICRTDGTVMLKNGLLWAAWSSLDCLLLATVVEVSVSCL